MKKIIDTGEYNPLTRCLMCGKAIMPDETVIIRGRLSSPEGEQRFTILHQECLTNFREGDPI